MAQSKNNDGEQVFQQRNFSGGMSNFPKEDNNPYAYAYSQCIDTRSDAFLLALNPATQKESGSIVTDLPKFADIAPGDLSVYSYGDTGNLYKRTSTGSWSLLEQVASSHGNGLGYFYGDDYLYYTNDKTIGRYGPLQGTPTLSDDFLTAQGGVPQNTYSLLLASASSQSADAADSATLSVTGNLSLEAYVNLNTLPAIGSSMTIVGKWDESGTLRSYLMDIFATSGYFGDGSDGALVISSNTTEAPIDSACTGTAGLYTLSATNASFAIGQPILIHQTQGTNAGQTERNSIIGYTAGTITLQNPLKGTYATGAQVRTLKQYTNVTVNNGFTWTAKAWNGTVGGILAFLANGTITVTGTISATNCGFAGGSPIGPVSSPASGNQGAGTAGSGAGGNLVTPNGNGGGAGGPIVGGSNSKKPGGGGGGGNGTVGTDGLKGVDGVAGMGGLVAGSSDLTTLVFGGGGGGGAAPGDNSSIGGAGGKGGGILRLIGTTITITGSVASSGVAGSAATGTAGAGGGGAGGSILLETQTGTLGTSLIAATGGTGGAAAGNGGNGGIGGFGRVSIHYFSSYTGTTTSPVLVPIQDNGLVTTGTYQLRLKVSSTGLNSETLTTTLSSLATGQWNRFSITWLAASSLATFYLNGSAIGTATGTLTSIHDNASLLYIGTNKGASTLGNYLNGYIDDVRIWGIVQTAANIFSYNNHQLTGNEGNLKAYYKLNNAATDATTNANNLTLRNTPVYSPTIIPFVDTTTRLDIDQSYVTTGSTYALGTAISEALADQLPFTPSFDPQKSIDLNVAAKGTGAWTVTIHDSTNRVIATQTITNANMVSSGYQEFFWTTPWRIVINKSYHAHITSTVADGTIVTSSLNTLQSGGSAVADFHTYYQFLVTDAFSHPIARMLNFIAIGNERYLAKWDGAFYQPNFIAFPAGTHVRCIGYWGTYLAIGTWQEAASGTPHVYDFPTGKIYFWDGISLTFNFSIDVPEGQVNAIYGMDADLYYIAGYKADLMYYHGSFANQSGSFNGTKVKRVPSLERSSYIETYPSAITTYQGLLYFAMAGASNSVYFPRNVYAWGTVQPQYGQSLTSEHVISTGNNGSSVKIGLVYPVGNKLLIGWQDGIAYGADIIDPNGVLYKSGYLQTTIQDGQEVWRNSLILKTRADHLPLTGDQAVQIGSYPNRATHFDVEHSATDPTAQFTVNPLENGRVTEWQMQVNLIGDGTSTPVVLAIAAKINELPDEEQF